jgi:hypothetical protein
MITSTREVEIQPRRLEKHFETISISDNDYVWAVAAARLRGVTVREWVEDLVRKSLGS